MTIPALPLPTPLPRLPRVSENLYSQVHTHASAVSPLNPTPYDRLALVGAAAIQVALAKILYRHSEDLDTHRITRLRTYFTSNIGRWAFAYGFRGKLIADPTLIPQADEFSNKLVSATFEAYLGAV